MSDYKYSPGKIEMTSVVVLKGSSGKSEFVPQHAPTDDIIKLLIISRANAVSPWYGST